MEDKLISKKDLLTKEKTDSLVLPMLKPGGTFNNLILRREDISDAEK